MEDLKIGIDLDKPSEEPIFILHVEQDSQLKETKKNHFIFIVLSSTGERCGWQF